MYFIELHTGKESRRIHVQIEHIACIKEIKMRNRGKTEQWAELTVLGKENSLDINETFDEVVEKIRLEKYDTLQRDRCL